MHCKTCLRQCIMFSNCGNGFEPISLVDLIERLGLQMLPLDRESHAIQTFQRLAIFFCSNALRHSFYRIIRSRLDEPWLLQCSCDPDTARERRHSSEESFASVRAGAVTTDLFGFTRKLALRTLVISS